MSDPVFTCQCGSTQFLVSNEIPLDHHPLLKIEIEHIVCAKCQARYWWNPDLKAFTREF